MEDEAVKREWLKGEVAAGALAISLLGVAASTLNLSMNVGKFIENTDIRLDHIEAYIRKDEQVTVTQLEKGYLIEKIATNSDEIRSLKGKTNKELADINRKIDALLKETYRRHGN